jgi:hypothetical protein
VLKISSTGVDMSVQEELINAMREKFPGESQSAIARHAGLSPARYHNYTIGIRQMDVDAVIGCAQALGWDIRITVAKHLQDTASTQRERSLWRKLSTTIGALFLTVTSITIAENVNANNRLENVKGMTPYTLCEIMDGYIPVDHRGIGLQTTSNKPDSTGHPSQRTSAMTIKRKPYDTTCE